MKFSNIDMEFDTVKINSFEYEQAVNSIQSAINNIEKLGIDIDQYQKELNSIIQYTKQQEKFSKENGLSNLNYINSYKRLNNLQSLLNHYQTYFKIYNYAKFLNLKLEDEMGPLELSSYICELEDELLLVQDDNLPYEEKKKVVELLYEVVYKAIKLEFVKNDFSALYDFCCGKDIKKFLFNDLIKKDIENTELPSKIKRELDLKILEIEKEGLANSYFDKDLIKTLAYFDKSLGKKKYAIKEVEESLKAALDFQNSILESSEGVSKEVKNYITAKEKQSKTKRDAFLKFGSAVASVCIFIGGSIGLLKFSKKITTSNKYAQKIVTYSSEYGLNETNNYIDVVSDDVNYVIVKEYSDYKESGTGTNKRDLKLYDLSDLELDNIEDYLKVDLTDKKYSTETEEMSNVDNRFIKSYKEVEKATIDRTREFEMVDKEEYLPIFLCLELLAIVLFLKVTDSLDEYKDIGIIGFASFISDKKLSKLISDEKKLKYTKKRLKKLLRELSENLKQNEKLRQQYNLVLEKNKSFLVDSINIAELNENEEIKKLSDFLQSDKVKIK